MSINGASRMLQAEAQLNKNSQSELNAKFKNENEVTKSINKFPLKAGASDHNHSSESLHSRK